jgi:hypothetical protein
MVFQGGPSPERSIGPFFREGPTQRSVASRRLLWRSRLRRGLTRHRLARHWCLHLGHLPSCVPVRAAQDPMPNRVVPRTDAFFDHLRAGGPDGRTERGSIRPLFAPPVTLGPPRSQATERLVMQHRRPVSRPSMSGRAEVDRKADVTPILLGTTMPAPTRPGGDPNPPVSQRRRLTSPGLFASWTRARLPAWRPWQHSRR